MHVQMKHTTPQMIQLKDQQMIVPMPKIIWFIDLNELKVKNTQEIRGFDGKMIALPKFNTKSYPYMLARIYNEYHVFDMSTCQPIAKA